LSITDIHPVDITIVEEKKSESSVFSSEYKMVPAEVKPLNKITETSLDDNCSNDKVLSRISED